MNPPNRLLHVTLTVSGEPRDAEVVRRALERLQQHVGFLHSLRYAQSSIELQYWEEADDMVKAVSLAYQFWNEHGALCGLTTWEIVGVEVLERVTLQRRMVYGAAVPLGLPDAQPRPF